MKSDKFRLIYNLDYKSVIQINKSWQIIQLNMSE